MKFVVLFFAIMFTSCKTIIITNSFNTINANTVTEYIWHGWVKLQNNGSCYVELHSTKPFESDAWMNIPMLSTADFKSMKGKILYK